MEKKKQVFPLIRFIKIEKIVDANNNSRDFTALYSHFRTPLTIIGLEASNPVSITIKKCCLNRMDDDEVYLLPYSITHVIDLKGNRQNLALDFSSLVNVAIPNNIEEICAKYSGKNIRIIISNYSFSCKSDSKFISDFYALEHNKYNGKMLYSNLVALFKKHRVLREFTRGFETEDSIYILADKV